MIYLDSSALLKLVIEEAESVALESWLAARGSTPLATSELAKVEVRRSARRVNPEAGTPARALVDGLDLIPLTSDIIEDAAELGDSHLRSLDALHLASALALGGALSDLVVYDRRFAEAATTRGLVTHAPGT